MSAPRNPNRRMAQAIVEELDRCGVTDACVSPGSRSTALALALDAASGIRVFVVGDERCAGFFALGLARERKRPALLLCTSGTAAANYLPAVVEASLSDVLPPLLVDPPVSEPPVAASLLLLLPPVALFPPVPPSVSAGVLLLLQAASPTVEEAPLRTST